MALWSISLKSGLQFHFKKKKMLSNRDILLCHSKVGFNNSSLLTNLLSSCVFLQHILATLGFFFLDAAAHWLPGCLLSHLCPFANSLWQVLILTPRHKWRHYFNNRPRSQWLCSGASTITGVMCGWCPSGRAASLNGWRRVTGCRGDALLMREPD